MAMHEFDQVYNDHRSVVWRLVSRYVSGHHDKEDLFQEVFLNVHKALPRFRGDSALSTWIYRVAVNTSLNYLKKLRRHKKIQQVMLGLRVAQVDPPADGPDQAIWRPLDKLNPRQKMILLLVEVEEKSLDEVARLLEVPIGTIKSNLHRAKEIVRKELRPERSRRGETE
jgi:RNA polymerase sigma-70 factor, ECF subfamily